MWLLTPLLMKRKYQWKFLRLFLLCNLWRIVTWQLLRLPKQVRIRHTTVYLHTKILDPTKHCDRVSMNYIRSQRYRCQMQIHHKMHVKTPFLSMHCCTFDIDILYENRIPKILNVWIESSLLVFATWYLSSNDIAEKLPVLWKFLYSYFPYCLHKNYFI